MFEQARQVADAVLYEGYLLYPYRASAQKNQYRWQFGVLTPRSWSTEGGGEPSWMQTDCFLTPGAGAEVRGQLRFLQLERREVYEAVDASLRATERLDIDGERFIPWDEANPQQVDFSTQLRVGSDERVAFHFEGSEWVETIRDNRGSIRGQVIRRRWPVSGEVSFSVSECASGVARLRIRVDNLTTCDTRAPRDVILRSSCLSAHLLLGISGGTFQSSIDPPEHVRAFAAKSENVHCYPVLVGEARNGSEVLASPIILYDYPEIAPESPGHTFDGTEIDELLALSTAALTDEEKREARATDTRAAELLDRAEILPPELRERLHGAIRSVPPRREPSLRVGSWDVTRGERVRLKPGQRRTDAQDMFLVGRVARVDKFLRDFEGKDYIAVTLEEDPVSELFRLQDRHLFFYPDEIEPLEAGR